MNQTQTTVQMFLHGHCFDTYTTSMPRAISAQVRNHLDAGWIVSDARRFRCNSQSTFHVYFVRPNDKTITATIVCSPALTHATQEDPMNQYTERQIADAKMDLNIAVEHLVDGAINVAQERFAEAADKHESADRRIAHASRVIGTTIDDVDALFGVALKNRCRAYPAVAALFPHHAPTPAPEEESLRGEIAKAQHQLDHADELEIPQVGRDAYRDVIRWTKRAITVATLAIALLTTQHASAIGAELHGACFPAGYTGEGFPVMACPLEHALYYIDLDGTDGALGTVGDGRWVQLP